MGIVLAVASLALIALFLLDAFESMVLPRRVTRTFRPARFYYRFTWFLWGLASRRIPTGKWREAFLSRFGPMSLLGLFATWVAGLIVGFGLLHWSLDSRLNTSPAEKPGLFTYLYLSGTTFFTLGYGDVTPTGPLERALAVVESGLGFGFMAVIIGYLPVLYQAFSRREVTISLLDARAGSPPSAAQFLLRLARERGLASAQAFLAEWERWAAELLESHLSFPVLSYYRSQHDNQSWLAALTMVLDTCALLIVAVVDLALVFRRPPVMSGPDRLPAERLGQLRQAVHEAGAEMRHGPEVDRALEELRAAYEPFAQALAHFFLFTLPPVYPEKTTVDNWQTSAWTRRTPGIGSLPPADGDDHFD